MKFSIACETYVRLSHICSGGYPEKWPHDYLRALYIERRHNNLIAIATNVKLAAVELMNKNDVGPDEHCFVLFDPALIEQARTEAQFSSTIEFLVMPELAMASAKTMFGYVHPVNVGLFPSGPTETENWRNWFPDKLPSESVGQMEIDLLGIKQLFEASPSKQLTFPTHIDANKPVVTRDRLDANFYGLFFPSLEGTAKPPAIKLPIW